MLSFEIADKESLLEFNQAIKDRSIIIKENNGLTLLAEYLSESAEILISPDFYLNLEYHQNEMDDLIYGKNPLTHVVNISHKGNNIHIFREVNGSVGEFKIPYKPWVLSNSSNSGTARLHGTQHYRFIKEYDTAQEYDSIKNAIWKYKLYSIGYHPEGFMVKHGITYFKGMKMTDLSYLSFDIETTGTNPKAKDAKVLIIANRVEKNGSVFSKLFRVDEFNNDDAKMIDSWCEWVRSVNPSLLEGHNIYIFDLPYLNERSSNGLALGRDGSDLTFDERPREKRKDGSQSYTYHRPNIFGREILDTFFLIITADSQRKFESYGLKSLIAEMGLTKPDRVFIYASKIKTLWNDLEVREKICLYALDDVEDTSVIRKNFMTSYFYFTTHIPKTFQQMMESATGGQINSFLVRGYLQHGNAIPKADDISEEKVEGGISFGVPGVYHNLVKVDLKSAYPSQILRFKMHNKDKDPKAYYFKMVEYFTLKRFEYKKLGKETGDVYYKDLDAVSKIFINSSYGVTNTSGVNFNDSSMARKITGETREVIDQALRWASGKDYVYWLNKFYDKMGEKEEDRNYLSVTSSLDTKITHDFIIGPTDTDSISLCKPDMSPFSKEELKFLLDELNDISPEFMVFEDDGYYDSVLCLKAKNYVLKNGDKYSYKGSALKSSKLEPILKTLLKECITDLLTQDGTNLQDIYKKYLYEALNPSSIKDWCQKKTVTKPILDCAKNDEARKNERDIYEAIVGKVIQEGDKIYVYPCIKESSREEIVLKNGKVRVKETKVTGLKCDEDYNNDADTEKLVDRVYSTMQIFSKVLGKDYFIDYTLVKNKGLLNEL